MYKAVNQKVAVVIPTGGSPYAESILRITDICLNAGLPAPSYTIGTISAADSKCAAVKWFLENTKAETLVMFDHDVIPPINFLDTLKHNLPIVGAPYPVYTPAIAKFPIPGVYKDTPNGYTVIDDVYARTGLVECDVIVGGALCIKREVLEKVKPPFVNRIDEWGILKNTEDVYFCEMAKEAGYKIYADYDVFCDHYTRVYLWKLMKDMAESYYKLSQISK